MEITFICIYNNEMQFNDMLLKSLNGIATPITDNNSQNKYILNPIGGGGDKELIINVLAINNQGNKYSSCAKAYNQALSLNKQEASDILIFLHQDIAFDNADFLLRIVTELTSNANQILGFAGMPTSGKTISNLKYYRTKQYITQCQLQEKSLVQSVDECCFAMSKQLFEKIGFDEYVCDGWHLYAVNFCYEAKQKLNTCSYVLPESIYHKYDGTSGQNTDQRFLSSIWKMRRKYHKDFDTIYTPCYIVKTSFFACLIKLLKTTIRNKMHK